MSEYFPCDICLEDKAVMLPQSPEVAVCGQCGFVYVPCRRSAQEIADSWSNEIYPGGGYDPNWPGVKARLYYVAEWIEQNIGLNGKDVLDIGAGNGNFMEFAYQGGAFVMGLEPSKENCALITAKKLPVINGTVEIAQDKTKYDIVTILWTLENCQDLNRMLRYAVDHCEPNGRVVVATGSRILVHPKKSMKSYFGKNAPDTHAFRFTYNSLTNAMVNNGMCAFLHNDYRENDVMIVSGKPLKPGMIRPQLDYDDPDLVQEFFVQWAEIDDFISKANSVSDS